MTPALDWLLQAATLAPSGDNTQPWRFVVDESAGRISLLIDENRDPSPMNSGQRMARIALGAAVENILRTAARNGWSVQLETAPGSILPVIQVHAGGSEPFQVEPELKQRVTNRKPYDGQPIAADVLDRLKEATPSAEGVVTSWITDRNLLPAIGELVGRADGLMFGNPSMRHAFLKKVRFDRPPEEEVEEGLSLACLELSKADRVGVSMMRWMPNWLFHLAGAPKKMHAASRQLVESSAGLCVVTAEDRTPATDLAVGRTMQRAWLALAREGLATQPMMSLPVLDNALENAAPELKAAVGPEAIRTLLDEAARHFSVARGRIAYLLRFGTTTPPTGRTARLPVSKCLTTTSAELSSSAR